jgi:hypothetical protein
MPEYTNQPPISDDTPVWRYFSRAAAVATVTTKTLRLTRVDTFEDPFEGSVPKQTMDDQVPLFSGGNAARGMMLEYDSLAMYCDIREDRWMRMTRLRRARTRSAHVSSWSIGDESELLYRLYCTEDGKPGVGVSLKSTFGRLRESLRHHDLYVSPINYRHYHTGGSFTDEMDALMHKRHGFKPECELRILHFNNEHYARLMPADSDVKDLEPHIYLPWHLMDAVDEIQISPYADEEFEKRVREELSAAAPCLADRITLSMMNPRRNPAYF